MKPWSKALAILSCRFSMEWHILSLDPEAVGIHLLRIIKPASTLSVRNIAAAEQEAWKKTIGAGSVLRVRGQPSRFSCQLLVQVCVEGGG